MSTIILAHTKSVIKPMTLARHDHTLRSWLRFGGYIQHGATPFFAMSVLISTQVQQVPASNKCLADLTLFKDQVQHLPRAAFETKAPHHRLWPCTPFHLRLLPVKSNRPGRKRWPKRNTEALYHSTFSFGSSFLLDWICEAHQLPFLRRPPEETTCLGIGQSTAQNQRKRLRTSSKVKINRSLPTNVKISGKDENWTATFNHALFEKFFRPMMATAGNPLGMLDICG